MSSTRLLCRFNGVSWSWRGRCAITPAMLNVPPIPWSSSSCHLLHSQHHQCCSETAKRTLSWWKGDSKASPSPSTLVEPKTTDTTPNNDNNDVIPDATVMERNPSSTRTPSLTSSTALSRLVAATRDWPSLRMTLPSKIELPAQFNTMMATLQTLKLPASFDFASMYKQAVHDWALYTELTELSSFAEFKNYSHKDIASGLCVIVATHTMLNVAQWGTSFVPSSLQTWAGMRPSSSVDPSTLPTATPDDINAATGLHANEWLRYGLFADAAYADSRDEFFKMMSAIAMPGELPMEEAVYGTWESNLWRRAFYIVADPIRRELLIVVRGTKTLHDVFTNAATAPSPFLSGQAHGGMVRSAEELIVQLDYFLSSPTAAAWRHHYTFDRITLIGHSLGAGTAGLATLMLHQRGDNIWPGVRASSIRCYGFGPPACMSGHFGDLERKIIALVHGDDIVPRVGTRNLQELRNNLLIFLQQGVQPVISSMTSEWFARLSLSTPAPSSSGSVVVLRPPGQLYHINSIPLHVPKPSKAQIARERQQNELLKKREAEARGSGIGMLATSFIAQRLPRMIRSSKFMKGVAIQPIPLPSVPVVTKSTNIPFRVTLAPTNADAFYNLVFSRTMISDHLMNNYIGALRSIATAKSSSSL